MKRVNQPTSIVIFAKAPLPGQVKTRLIPALGEEGAAKLAKRMLKHTVEQVHKACAQEPLLSAQLCVAPATTSPYWQAFTANTTLTLTEQGEGDLGERLDRAAARVLSQGSKVLLIGTDCPAISAELLMGAAAQLDHQQAVICPTYDGGYALLGLAQYHPAIFADIAWSTDQVARQTMARLKALGLSTAQLAMLHDIDEPADLQHLPKGWLEGMVVT